MISAERQNAWFEDHLQSAVALSGQDIGWLKDVRKSAEHALEKLPIMDRKSEAWRYSHVESLLDEQFISPVEPESDDKAPDLAAYALPSFDAYRLVFVDGRYVSGPPGAGNLPSGVNLGRIPSPPISFNELIISSSGKVASYIVMFELH